MDLEFPTSGLHQYENSGINLPTGAYGINSSSPILNPHADINSLLDVLEVNLFDEKFKSLIRSHTKISSSRNVLHNNGEFTFLHKDYLGKPQPKQVYYQNSNNVSEENSLLIDFSL